MGSLQWCMLGVAAQCNSHSLLLLLAAGAAARHRGAAVPQQLTAHQQVPLPPYCLFNRTGLVPRLPGGGRPTPNPLPPPPPGFLLSLTHSLGRRLSTWQSPLPPYCSPARKACSARSIARPSAADLFTVSSYSASGLLSATIPAPACRYTLHSRRALGPSYLHRWRG